MLTAFLHRPRTLILAAALAAFLPFLHRPVFVDDHAHYQQALDIASRPFKPYSDAPGTLGWARGERPGEANPLVYFYLLGATAKIFGPDVWKAHVVLIPFHLLALFGFYALARRVVRHAAWATLLWLVTPHFWLTANALLVDSLLAPMMMGGLGLWVSGWEREKNGRLLAGAVLLGLSPLVKYTGVLAWPVAVLWTFFLLDPRPKPARWLFLFLPPLMMAAWLGWTRSLYGETHIDAVARGSLVMITAPKTLLVGIFSIGTSLCLLLLPALAAAGRFKVPAVSWGGEALAAVLGYVFFAETAWVGGLMAFWAGAAALWAAAAAAGPRDKAKTVLWLWVLLGGAGLAVARDWVCARYIVVIGPPLVLLTCRALETRAPSFADARVFRAAAFLACAAAGGMLAAADAAQAAVDMRAARALEQWRQNAGVKVGQYPGALLSGLGFYLPAAAWKPLPSGAVPAPGSVVAVPARGLPPAFLPLLRGARPVHLLRYTGPLPLRTLDARSRAGFYGSVWGPLPFSFSTAPLEEYSVFALPSDEGGR